MSTAFRRATAILLLTIAGASPSLANPYHPRRAFEDPVHLGSVRSFLVAVLTGIFEFAGGAMDPNGKS